MILPSLVADQIKEPARAMRFGKDRRVLKHPEYRLIQKLGRRVSTPYFVLVLHPRRIGDALHATPEAPSRLGITASKRVGNSVRRSRLKRLVREAFLALPDLLPAGVDMVVICKKDDPTIDLQTVVSDWLRAQKRIQRALAAPAHQRAAGRSPRRRGRGQKTAAGSPPTGRSEPS